MKNLARILAMALIVVMALSLVGCGPKSKIKGEWEGEFMGVDITMEFDGKEVTMEVMGQEETTDYEFDGKELIIDGEEVEYEFDGRNTLILDMDGEELELTRK
ncbi:MAG: hypothetical protein IJE02_06895 [Clostridia bacterium]|nr:hypothetical protein [Clostridia bacterium]